jgi:hypothetical protein
VYIILGIKMKRIFVICYIFISIIFSQLALSHSINSNEYLEKKFIWKNRLIDFDNDPPGWATGEFNGTWGLSVLGLPAVELGWIYGYFSLINIFGRIEGYFSEWKYEEPTAYITGYIILYNMIGVISDIDNGDNTSFFMGLGVPNEKGVFYYRINLIFGPSWYMTGTWKEIIEG